MRATPDGSMSYACFRCLPVDEASGGGGAGGDADGGSSPGAGAPTNPAAGAAAGGTSNGGAGTGAAGKAGSGDAKSSDDGGCSLAQAHGGGGALAALLVALGCALAGLRRRRSLAS